jgi:hypothetical protein
MKKRNKDGKLCWEIKVNIKVENYGGNEFGK